MFEGYLVPIFIAIVVLAGVSFAISKSLTSSSGQKRASLPNTQVVMTTPRRREESSVQKVAPNKDAELIAKLLGQLRQICLGDEAKAQRLIGFERKRNPNADLAVLIQDVIDRWRDDNR